VPADLAVGLTDQALQLGERLVPAQLLDGAVVQIAPRRENAILGVEVGRAETALVAEPAAIDLGVVAREHALDASLPALNGDVATDPGKGPQTLGARSYFPGTRQIGIGRGLCDLRRSSAPHTMRTELD